MRTEARFPGVGAGRGHYESFYVKASHPAGGRAIWLRHTTHQRPGEPATGALWLTVFDADAPGPRATKATVPASRISTPAGAYIEVGDAVLGPGRATGSISGDVPGASWELEFTDDGESLRHLPREFMYSSRLPRTKLLSPYPSALFDGRVELGGEVVELDGWPGMVGHNWGAEHAEQWIWIQAGDLAGVRGDHLDVGIGKVKIGPFTTPWIANGRIVLSGEEYRLGGLGNVYGTDVEASTDGCTFTLPGKNVNVKGRVSAPAKDFVGWVYADPAGPDHNAINCSISDIELRVERPGERHAKIAMAGAAAYELGTRDTDHGVPLQPFPDG